MIRVESSIGNLKARIPMKSILFKSWHSIGDKLVKFTQESMKKPKHGKTYVINGKKHTASAAGEAPAIQSGDLYDSVRYQIEGSDMLFGAGSDRVNYAKFLELGTQKMEQRPFIVRSVEENFKEIEVEFEDTFKTGVRS